MIQEFVNRFMDKKSELRFMFSEKHPEDYKDLVQKVISVLHDPSDVDAIDPGRVHEIDHGDYQGTLVYVIADDGYQPDTYWYVKVGYGSCSGCDTLEAICSFVDCDDKPTSQQVDDYMTLALHIVQGLKKMDSDAV